MDEQSVSSTETPSLARRTILSAIGAAGVGVAGIGVFAGTAVAWETFDVDFKGCSEVWIIVDEEDLDYEEYGRDEPLYVKVVVERDGAAECETVWFTEESTTTIPGQYGDDRIAKFDDGEKILAVIKYNENDVAICYVENEHRCAETPGTPDWRDAACYDDLTEPPNPDEDRFNLPCSEKGNLRSGNDDGPGRANGPGRN